jgi:hypothetical protein
MSYLTNKLQSDHMRSAGKMPSHADLVAAISEVRAKLLRDSGKGCDMNGIKDLLVELSIARTRENYISINWGTASYVPTPEEEAELPEEFQLITLADADTKGGIQ